MEFIIWIIYFDKQNIVLHKADLHTLEQLYFYNQIILPN
jgi:hypothetical protein